jgi:hypothetical protein
MLAQISRIGPQPPLMNAVVRTEGSTPLCQDLQPAPPAQR